MHRVGVFVATLGLALAACEDEVVVTTVEGGRGVFAGQEVSTFARLQNGQVTEVGARLPLAAIQTVSGQVELSVDFPSEVRGSTFFHHLGLEFREQGHVPPVFQLPHFDVHFYGIDRATRDAIDCRAEPMPAKIPAGYVIPSTAQTPQGTCEPKMGVHAVPAADVDPQQPKAFTATMILGYHNGALSFVEPMVTKDFLLGERSVTLPLPSRAEVDVITGWPTQAAVTFDGATRVYTISLRGMTTLPGPAGGLVGTPGTPY